MAYLCRRSWAWWMQQQRQPVDRDDGVPRMELLREHRVQHRRLTRSKSFERDGTPKFWLAYFCYRE